jgi:hypothetical protein
MKMFPLFFESVAGMEKGLSGVKDECAIRDTRCAIPKCDGIEKCLVKQGPVGVPNLEHHKKSSGY